MYFTTAIVLAAVASVANAQATQTLGGLPDCAKACAANLPAKCNLDVKCICSDTDYINSIACCVAKSCPADQVQKTLMTSQQLCSTVNVKLPTAPPSGCAGGAGGSSSSSSSSSTSSASAPTVAAGYGNSTMGNSTAYSSGMIGSSTMMGGGKSTSTTTGTAKPSATSGSASASASSGAASSYEVKGAIGALGAAMAALAMI